MKTTTPATISGTSKVGDHVKWFDEYVNAFRTGVVSAVEFSFFFNADVFTVSEDDSGRKATVLAPVSVDRREY